LSDVINKVQLEVSQGKQKDEVIKNMFLPFVAGALSVVGLNTVIEQIIDSANETAATEGEGEPAEYPEELETVGDQPEVPAQEAPVDDLVYHGEEPEAPNLPDGSENWSDEQFNDWLEKMGIEAEPEPPPSTDEAPEEEMYENILRTIKEETRRLLKQRGII
jgi:hypothetical protein